MAFGRARGFLGTKEANGFELSGQRSLEGLKDD
jgi:hypothetical protein